MTSESDGSPKPSPTFCVRDRGGDSPGKQVAEILRGKFGKEAEVKDKGRDVRANLLILHKASDGIGMTVGPTDEAIQFAIANGAIVQYTDGEMAYQVLPSYDNCYQMQADELCQRLTRLEDLRGKDPDHCIGLIQQCLSRNFYAEHSVVNPLVILCQAALTAVAVEQVRGNADTSPEDVLAELDVGVRRAVERAGIDRLLEEPTSRQMLLQSVPATGRVLARSWWGESLNGADAEQMRETLSEELFPKSLPDSVNRLVELVAGSGEDEGESHDVSEELIDPELVAQAFNDLVPETPSVSRDQ